MSPDIVRREIASLLKELHADLAMISAEYTANCELLAAMVVNFVDSLAIEAMRGEEAKRLASTQLAAFESMFLPEWLVDEDGK